MAEKSGFFNAKETSTDVYDRVYDAEDFAKYFATFIGNGVFVNPSDQLKVVPKTGLTVTVKAGKAFIDGYWYELDEDMDITLSVNSTTNTINDVIACTLNKLNRTISTVKKEKVNSVLPVNNGTTHELILAIVSVGVGVSSLTASNITDTRLDSTYCGYVGALIEQVDFGNLFNQMESQFNDWFDEMKDQLTEDAAGNLQMQIAELDSYTKQNLEQISQQLDVINTEQQPDGDWSKYQNNGWSFSFRKIGRGLVYFEGFKTIQGVANSIGDEVVATGIPVDVSFSQRIMCEMSVAGAHINNGMATLKNDRTMTLSSPAYGNPVTYIVYGVVYGVIDL